MLPPRNQKSMLQCHGTVIPKQLTCRVIKWGSCPSAAARSLVHGACLDHCGVADGVCLNTCLQHHGHPVLGTLQLEPCSLSQFFVGNSQFGILKPNILVFRKGTAGPSEITQKNERILRQPKTRLLTITLGRRVTWFQTSN